ncbi:hypothetical protein DPMN_014476 [Dreissena polymorpha]|uniref:Uncharacterized protein n=1 Tax=Dreissena polymorpha TaxID=45954 RepID=A0A9D4N9S3_DREPO|nr:hypothetical protein DPMN_014476 [Dreissena polymorpha]
MVSHSKAQACHHACLPPFQQRNNVVVKGFPDSVESIDGHNGDELLYSASFRIDLQPRPRPLHS